MSKVYLIITTTYDNLDLCEEEDIIVAKTYKKAKEIFKEQIEKVAKFEEDITFEADPKEIYKNHTYNEYYVFNNESGSYVGIIIEKKGVEE